MEFKSIQHLTAELNDTKHIPTTDDYTKTQWNVYFKLCAPSSTPRDTLTKRGLVSDVAKTFDALGLFSPSTIKAKILMQQLWELKINWDDPVPEDVMMPGYKGWSYPLQSQMTIPRCYSSKESQVLSTEIHGFSDASEVAYTAVVYLTPPIKPISHW